MSQLNKWMTGGKISKLVVVITSKETGEHVERWQFDVSPTSRTRNSATQSAACPHRTAPPRAHPSPTTNHDRERELTTTQVQINPSKPPTHPSSSNPADTNQENTTPPSDPEIQSAIQAIFRQITASVTFLPTLDAQGPCTFNVLVYADADSEVPLEWGDSDAKAIENAESVRLRGFSTASHRVEAAVEYRVGG